MKTSADAVAMTTVGAILAQNFDSDSERALALESIEAAAADLGMAEVVNRLVIFDAVGSDADVRRALSSTRAELAEERLLDIVGRQPDEPAREEIGEFVALLSSATMAEVVRRFAGASAYSRGARVAAHLDALGIVDPEDVHIPDIAAILEALDRGSCGRVMVFTSPHGRDHYCLGYGAGDDGAIEDLREYLELDPRDAGGYTLPLPEGWIQSEMSEGDYRALDDVEAVAEDARPWPDERADEDDEDDDDE